MVELKNLRNWNIEEWYEMQLTIDLEKYFITSL